MSIEAELLQTSIEKLVKQHAPNADLSSIDDIVISYITGVIEEVALEDEDVDSSGVMDVMAAYIPSFNAVPEQTLATWVLDMANHVNELKNKGKSNASVTLDSIVSSFPIEIKTSSRSVSETSERSQKLSETSNSSDDTPKIFDEDQYSEGLSTLLEMFPGACNLEIQHCLSTCGGDIEAASCLVLERQEQGVTFKNMSSKGVPLVKKVDEKSLKDSIINRYGFVDKDDDSREHRPVAPKWEGKKMVRYRDNKVVSLKGERYTEIKKDDADDIKKSYTNMKQSKQHKFH